MLPPDQSDFDQDGDRLETLPFDLAGRDYTGVWPFLRQCDAGCFQYDGVNADSDLDGFSDAFERSVAGNSFGLYIPRITTLTPSGQELLLTFEYVRRVRDFTDFVFEGAAELSGPWTELDGKRIRSAAINATDGSETWQLFSEEGQRFFRVRTIPED